LGDNETKEQNNSPAKSSLSKAHGGPPCISVDRSFADEVWAKVGERMCLKCNNAKGDASDSEFLLHDTSRAEQKRYDALMHNQSAFARMAKVVSSPWMCPKNRCQSICSDNLVDVHGSTPTSTSFLF